MLLMLVESLTFAFALGFVSVDEFVSFAQLMSLLLAVLLLLTFNELLLLLLLLGVVKRCVRSFSSRRHFAL
jgi:hypothetical protein